MARLTKQQLRYLDRHAIPAEETYDASGLTRKEYRERMRREGKFIAYGVTPCLNGHTLRTRSGNCIECSSAAIAYSRRSALPGYVYIAVSQTIDLIKIGFSSDDPDNRIYIANCEGYGEAYDWTIHLTVWSDRAGTIEFQTQKRLSYCREDRVWMRNGCDITTKELFACDLEVAVQALHDSLTSDEEACVGYR